MKSLAIARSGANHLRQRGCSARGAVRTDHEQVTAFASSGAPQDDRTLLVVKFSQSEAAAREWKCVETQCSSGRLIASAKVNTERDEVISP